MAKTNIPKGLKTNSSKKVRMDWNTEEFEKRAKKLIDDIPENLEDILVESAPDFVKGAFKWTPPSMGKNTIDKKYFTRPILILIRLIRGGYYNDKPTDEDIRQFKAGMVYKVLNTKAGVPKGTAYAYCKTKGAAKKAAKIETRGLSRVMWGKNLGDIGAEVPATLQRLLRKSSVLGSLNLNEVNIKKEQDETTLNITNDVAKIERYARIAESQGYKKVLSSIMKRLKKLADKDVEL